MYFKEHKVYSCRICGKKSANKTSVDRCCKEQLVFINEEGNTYYHGLISKYKTKEEVLKRLKKS